MYFIIRIKIVNAIFITILIVLILGIRLKKKKQCIICKKKDTKDLDKLEKKINNVYEFLFQFSTILFIKISFIFLLYMKSN